MSLILILQNVITMSVNLADNLMLGAYSESALSGAAAVNQVQFIYQQILLAIGEGIVILGGQYYGKEQYLPYRRIAATAMRLGILSGAVLFLFVSAAPRLVLSAFTTDELIIAEGMRYLSIIRFSYLFFAVTQILLATLRGTGVVRIALYLSIVSMTINCCINYAVIYGNFGAPEMGIRGAAIGTLTARVIEMIVCVIYVWKKNKLELHFSDYLCSDVGLRKDYLKIMLPMLVINSLWGFNNAAQTMILGHMTSRAIAANSVSTTLFLMVKCMAVGVASTASFMIAKKIGEDRGNDLKQYARTMQILFVFVGIFAGIILYSIRIPVLNIYHLEMETKAMANQFLLILSVTVVTMSYQMPVNSGIIKGGGDTKYCMILDLISIWGIVLPLSFIMAFVFKASPVVVVWCLNADQIFKCIPAFIKVNYGHWAKKLTRNSLVSAESA